MILTSCRGLVTSQPALTSFCRSRHGNGFHEYVQFQLLTAFAQWYTWAFCVTLIQGCEFQAENYVVCWAVKRYLPSRTFNCNMELIRFHGRLPINRYQGKSFQKCPTSPPLWLWKEHFLLNRSKSTRQCWGHHLRLQTTCSNSTVQLRYWVARWRSPSTFQHL